MLLYFALKSATNFLFASFGRSLTHCCAPGTPMARSFSRGSDSSSMVKAV